MPSLVVYKGYSIGRNWASQVFSLHTQSSKVRSGRRLCSISTMPILVVYKEYSGHVRQYMCYFFTNTIIGDSVGPAHVLNPDDAFTGCVQRISYRSQWASRVLFITYTIIEGLVGPAHVLNPDHAFTGCVQRISYRPGWASQVLFITYTIIEDQVGPAPVLSLDHAFTGCV